MNNRANIMYFLEHLCDMAARENHYDYIRMIQRDIMRIVDAVAPDDGSGAANVKVVRKVRYLSLSALSKANMSRFSKLYKQRPSSLPKLSAKSTRFLRNAIPLQMPSVSPLPSAPLTSILLTSPALQSPLNVQTRSRLSNVSKKTASVISELGRTFGLFPSQELLDQETI